MMKTKKCYSEDQSREHGIFNATADETTEQIRKHMVSLRGSKYGSRVAMLCCNPAVATRPGPPAGLSLSRNNSGYGDRFGSDMSRSYSSDRQFFGGGRGGYGAPYR